jgi:hypothetical protein
MAAMNSDVNDNHLVISIDNGCATVVQLVLDATKSVIVMMAVMKSGVVMIALVMMLFLVVTVRSVPSRACNGITECDDGSDERDCSAVTRNNVELPG